jgi:hypothetical protein
MEPNPGLKEAVVEWQETSNEEVAINSLWACQNERTTCQEATEANLEKMEPFDRMLAILEQMIAMTETIQEKMATMDLKENPEEIECEKPASEDMTPEVAHEQEFPLEDAVVMPVRKPRKRRRDRRHLAAQRRQKKEHKWYQRKDWCRKNLVAACRAAVAWGKINLFRKILTRGFCGLRK